MNKGRERELGIGWKEKERIPIVMINHTATKYNSSVAVELDRLTITCDDDYVLSTTVPAEIVDRRYGCIYLIRLAWIIYTRCMHEKRNVRGSS